MPTNMDKKDLAKTMEGVRLCTCNIVFISDKINTRVVSNIIEQEVSTPETVKDTFG